MPVTINNQATIDSYSTNQLSFGNQTYSASFVSNSYAVNYISSSTTITIGAERTIDSYANANADQNNYIANGDNDAIGQSFRSGGEKLTRVTFYGRAVGSPTGNTFAQLYSHSGNFGTTGFPSGSVLATSDAINAASVSTTAGPILFTFSGDQQYIMTSGSVYVIAWYYTGGSTSNHFACEVDISSPTAAGRAYYLNGTTWTTTTQDPTGTSGATDDMTFILSGSAVTVTTTTISPTNAASYSFSNRDANITLGTFGSNTAFGTSFLGNGERLYNVKFSMLKTGTPTGSMIVKIYEHTGTYGTNGTPTGNYLAYADPFNVATLTASNVTYSINFTGKNAITTNNGTPYFLTAEYNGGSSGNTVSLGVDSSSPTYAGNSALITTGSSTWVTSSSDLCFELYSVRG